MQFSVKSVRTRKIHCKNKSSIEFTVIISRWPLTSCWQDYLCHWGSVFHVFKVVVGGGYSIYLLNETVFCGILIIFVIMLFLNAISCEFSLTSALPLSPLWRTLYNLYCCAVDAECARRHTSWQVSERTHISPVSSFATFFSSKSIALC